MPTVLTAEPDRTPTPLDSALELAALGWRVVPITPHKKHPPLPAWQDAATTDPNIIINWWAGLYKNHGIGVACGKESGVWVLDVDVADGKQGLTELHKLIADHGELPPTPTAQTGTGGWHYYFAWPETGTITNGMSTNLGAHLDIRGEGGQVLAPPTVHPNGNPYAWCAGLSPWDVTVADAPDWLLDLLQTPKPPPARPAPTMPAGDPEDGPAARYNATHTWDEILAADGWELTGIERDGEQHWRRPLAYGPTDSDTGATVGYKGGGALVVFTTSIPWLPPAAYSRFGYYACRWHNGDRSTAARALKEQEQPSVRAPLREIPNQPAFDPTDPGPDIDGWAARDRAHAAADAEAAAITTPADTERPRPTARDVVDFVTEPEPDYDWLVEGLLERGDRLILTGPEGGGKSTLQRQMAVQIACGLHPFTLDVIEPRRVLIVDLENGRRQIRRKLTELLALTKPGRGMLWVAPKSEGLNLAAPDDQQWLIDVIDQTRPDFVMIGPLYKLSDGDPTEEKVAKPVAVLLDRLREAYGFALVLEAHTPHSQNGSAKRPMRPYGASLWLRWPEFGLHLSPEGILHHWRGPRDERAWPTVLARGTASEWPWVVPADRSVKFHDILQACRDAGRVLSVRDISDTTGIPKSTVARAISANADQWDALVDGLEGEEF